MQQRSPVWVKAALGVVLSPLLVGLLAFVKSRETKTQAWPAILKVAQRLQTDEEAAILFRANPDLAKFYGTEAVFLDRVRTYRDQFANLPGRLPATLAPNDYFFTPFGFYLRVRGSGQAWATIEARRESIFQRTSGEGLTRLEFAPTSEGSDLELRAVRKAKAAYRQTQVISH
jgi:hypothetical protein